MGFAERVIVLVCGAVLCFGGCDGPMAGRGGSRLGGVAATTEAPPTSRSVNRWSEKAAQPGLSRLRREAYAQMALLPEISLTQISIPGSYEVTTSSGETPHAAAKLFGMGLSVVPVLAEALDDTTMTRTFTMHGTGTKTQHAVNDIVATLITRICQHTITVGEGEERRTIGEVVGHPERAGEFQRAVMAWYRVNRDRTLLERKLADLDDAYHQNRLDAVEWLGRNKERRGGPAVVSYMERTLAGQQWEFLKQTELAECSGALGQMGYNEGLGKVRDACRYLSLTWIRKQCPKQWADVGHLFQAYEGLAKLGGKEAAVKELRRIFESYSGEWEKQYSEDYEKRLEKAQGW